MLFMGSTGEPTLMTPEEKKQLVVETAKMKSGKMKFFYGCTGNTVEQVIDNVKWVKANGGDGAIIAAPPYLCAPEDDIEGFYLEVADVTVMCCDSPNLGLVVPTMSLGDQSGRGEKPDARGRFAGRQTAQAAAQL